MGIRAAGFALAAALLAWVPAAAQERLSLAPGHTLRFHAAPGPEQPDPAARYLLDLERGDWLVVTAPAAIVQGAGTEPPLKLTGPRGEEAREFGRLLHRAESSGTWVLEARDFHALSVARYPAGHPVVDVGVAPSAVKLEAGGLGAVAMMAEPMEPRYDDVPPPSGWPARLAIRVGERMTIHLYRRAALRQMELWANDPTRNLEAMLAGDFPIEASLALPMFPIGEYFVSFTARPERVRGACFGFLRYVARWTQEEVYPFETLTYAALGLSRDGRWFAVATAELAPAALPGQPTVVQEGRSSTYEAALSRALAVNPQAVSPDLAALDRVIASLVLPCDGEN